MMESVASARVSVSDVAELPEGLVYREGFIGADEERQLVRELEALDFRAVQMRGQTARRTVRHFGLDYEYETGELVPGDPLPETLGWLRDRGAALMERDRSAYLLSGKARWSWQHSIPATDALRYSITFRTLKRA
jgi:alkylated DNA repair dioxygenase AlkB